MGVEKEDRSEMASKIEELIKSGRAQEALNKALDGPFSGTVIYPTEPSTLREGYQRYNIPVPNIDQCKIETDVPHPGFFKVTLPVAPAGNLRDVTIERSIAISIERAKE